MAQSTAPCRVDGCPKTLIQARGLCAKHYARWQRTGDPEGLRQPPPPPLIERFHAGYRVAANGCWIWQKPTSNGYGGMSRRKKKVWAHRIGYELLVGPIPDGLELDHLCHTPACVNPAHLEPVTHRENLRRGDTIFGRTNRSNACMRGHAYTPENTYRWGIKRMCRACIRERQRTRKAA